MEHALSNASLLLGEENVHVVLHVDAGLSIATLINSCERPQNTTLEHKWLPHPFTNDSSTTSLASLYLYRQ